MSKMKKMISLCRCASVVSRCLPRMRDAGWVSRMFVKLKTAVLNDTPKYRSEGARECGSGKLKARKVESGEKQNECPDCPKCGRLSGLFCWRRGVQNVCKTENRCAQRHSKVSELGAAAGKNNGYNGAYRAYGSYGHYGRGLSKMCRTVVQNVVLVQRRPSRTAISQSSQASQNSQIMKPTVLNDTPKYRNGERRGGVLNC
jgi:hypothetical protein